MLTIKVELNPWWGNVDGRDDKVIAEMTIYNTGEKYPSDRSDYVCIVHDMRDGKKEKRVGAVEGHYRNQDVWILVRKCLEDMYPC